MPSDVSEKFIKFLKTIRKQAKISTRELGKSIGKSAMYISYLENSKINTIDFQTAFKILDTIYEKQPFITGNINGDSSSEALITNMLIETFAIEPEDLIKQRIQWEEQQEEVRIAQYEAFQNKLTVLTSLIDFEDDEFRGLLDLMIRMVKMNNEKLNDNAVSCLNDILNMIDHKETKILLFQVIGLLSNNTWGTSYYTQGNNQEFNNELKQLFIKYNYYNEPEVFE